MDRWGVRTFGRQDAWATDVWATNFLSDDHLGDMGWTFEPKASRRLGDKNEALRLEEPQRRGSCGTHLSKVHRRSNTDWQRLKRLWSRLVRRKHLPRTDIHSGPNVQLLSPKRSSEKSVAQTSVDHRWNEKRYVRSYYRTSLKSYLWSIKWCHCRTAYNATAKKTRQL